MSGERETPVRGVAIDRVQNRWLAAVGAVALIALCTALATLLGRRAPAPSTVAAPALHLPACPAAPACPPSPPCAACPACPPPAAPEHRRR